MRLGPPPKIIIRFFLAAPIFLNFLNLQNGLVLGLVRRIKVRCVRLKLRRAGINQLKSRDDAFFLTQSADLRFRDVHDLSQLRVAKTVFFGLA